MTDEADTADEADKPKKREQAQKVDKVQVEVPEQVNLNDLLQCPLAELQAKAQELGLRVAGVRSKHQLIFEVLTFYGRQGTRIEAVGVLDYNGENYGFLRWPELSFMPNVDDVYVSPSFIRQYDLKPGNLIKGWVRAPQDREKFLSLDSVMTIEGVDEADWKVPVPFDKLTALFPSERLILEHPSIKSISPRVVDLVAPLGKGQRGLIVAPPRAGKTILLKDIAISIQKNHPEVELIILLLDERPEEVTDFKESVNARVYASTFDESPKRHVQVSEMVAQRAKRLVEMGKDVVILLDSLTRLSRGHNANMPGKGRTGSGGLNTQALEKPRKFFGAARNVEEGGSLTILATCLVETDSRMDDVIFEEFKGTGNMEIYLDRELAEKRVFPAIHTLQSGTRKDELLYHPDEQKRVNGVRRQLAKLPAGEAMETLVKNIKLTGTNAELLLRGLR
ncbi:MAG: transcription termination factor Rho [Verrucomicrobiales bacterium]|nr:transcription termination factor Rho [Verrucomicrobiales bacterium]